MYSSITFCSVLLCPRNILCTKKCLFPYLYFRLACLSKIISVLLPLRNPMNCATLKLGGILISMWIWSAHACASIISTFFCLHNSLSNMPISDFSFLYISFRRYLGAKTTWYCHLHFECDKLSMSFTTKPPFASLCGWQTCI